MLNHIVIMGRMTRDPELQRTGSGVAVANFTVAVDRDFKNQSGEKETDFFDCVAWRQTGEFVSKYFRKGSMVVVSGRLTNRNWTDKDGNKRRSAEIVADNVYFGESKKSAESNGAYQGSGYGSAYPEAEAAISRYSGAGQGGYTAPEYMQPDFPILDSKVGLPF
ncbi:MAG: single-stranded DNA-binding protein [Candidatus Limivicinus sp.]